MLNCHCRDCQRSTGGPFSAGGVVPAPAFKIICGELRLYFSGRAGREFPSRFLFKLWLTHCRLERFSAAIHRH